MSNATETVKFNVGGRHFEVSRALIDGHSETVLGKLVSDNWNDDQDKAVFIDRDGDIFAHVLNYLRYGSIELPCAIPRSMFDRELDYYGITSDKDVITVQGSIGGTFKAFAKAKKDFAKAQREYEMHLLAIECYSQLCQSNDVWARVEIPKGHKLFSQRYLASEEKKLLDKYLDEYFGLMVVTYPNKAYPNKEVEVCRGGDGFFVRVKE